MITFRFTLISKELDSVSKYRDLHSKREQNRNVEQNTAGSNIAKHSWTNNYVINFEDGQVVDKGNSRTRKTLESWQMAIKAESDHNSKPLPKQHGILSNSLIIHEDN